MYKGILVSAISASLLALSACSSEQQEAPKAEAEKTTVAAVAEKASASAEKAAETAKAAVEESKEVAANATESVKEAASTATAAVTSAVTTAADKTTAAVAGAAATAGAAVSALKDENGNTVVTQAVIDAKVMESRAAVKAFGGALKTELVTAMKAGGPLNAIPVCNEKAPAIAEKVTAEKGVNISRVSLKNRNPEGAPSEWQRKVLEDFESRKAAGEDPAKLEYTEVVEMEGKHTLRYMKAIPAGKKVCMTCHGTEIKDEVKAKLNELYPEDKATGYSVGDLRGAFVVTQTM